MLEIIIVCLAGITSGFAFADLCFTKNERYMRPEVSLTVCLLTAIAAGIAIFK